MDQSEAYLLLFTDSLLGNLAITLNNELIVHSMKIFGSYNNLLIVIIATIASICATSVNYLLGRILSRVIAFSRNEDIQANYRTLSHLFWKYNLVIICLIIVPFWGRFIPLIAGFTKVRFIRVVAISTISKLCYYCLSILFN
jgi:membrane protein YqaA with SNARE-associated domain